MIVGQNQSQTLLYHTYKKDPHAYHVFYSTVTGFTKSLKFTGIQRPPVANFIGSIIG